MYFFSDDHRDSLLGEFDEAPIPNYDMKKKMFALNAMSSLSITQDDLVIETPREFDEPLSFDFEPEIDAIEEISTNSASSRSKFTITLQVAENCIFR